MESSIWLFAYLCSREVFVSLNSFYQGLKALRAGVVLFSDEFFEACPELRFFAVKYLRKDLILYHRELLQCVEKGCLLLYPSHPFFPEDFLYLDEVPFLLRMQGSPIWLGLPGLSVVGHREPTHPSQVWMEEHLGGFLRENSCFVVSGGARGVDQKAHSLALRYERPTVVFLPSGLERIYPTSLQSWVPEILAGGGALISEYENQREMEKHFFRQRNRLISGLGKATLIVEARRHSGTMLTAHEALDQSKPLWILPGHPMDPHCQGSLDLLVDGGTPILSADQLSEFFASEIQAISYCFERNVRDLVKTEKAAH